MEQTNRQCGACQLCCKVLPTEEIKKPAAQRCRHQKVGVGCAIYAARPVSCRLWSCMWRVGEDVGDRPDRSRLIIDPTPDYITTVDDETGERVNHEVVQVWCEAADRDAHRNPKFRAWLEARKVIALVRFDNKSGLVLCPPNRSTDGKWVEKWSAFKDIEHTTWDKLTAGLSFNIPIVVEEDAT